MSKALANNFTAYTLSGKTLENIRCDIPGLVRRYVQSEVSDKTGVETYRTSKGKNTLFFNLCAFVKSICQLDDNQRLPDDIADAIRSSIRESVNDRLQILLDEYSEHHVAIKTEVFGLKIRGDKWTAYKKASVSMERHNLDWQQQKWAARCEISKLSNKVAKLEAKTELAQDKRTELAQLKADLETAENAHKYCDEQLKLETPDTGAPAKEV